MDFTLPRQTSLSIDTSLNLNADFWFVIFFGVAAAFILLFAVKKIIRMMAQKNRYYDHVVYLVRLPKDKPKDQEKESSLQQLREEIARG
ncbi:MAG: hypothetical protein AAB906_01765, partial [Patescibacteria group bacterium]